MVTRRRFLLLAGSTGVVAAAAVVGVAVLPGDEPTTGLPVIRLGGEKCARCGMVIGDERFVAAWREPGGEERHFDDIGCLVMDRAELTPAEGSEYWVADYLAGDLLSAPTATFVVAPTIKTPMSYGVVAVASASSAEAVAGENDGTVYRWDEIPEEMVPQGTRTGHERSHG